jgi:hypothetical protein
MGSRLFVTVCVVGAVAAASASSVSSVSAGQKDLARPGPKRGAAKTTVPRTMWGDPDLQGIWNNATSTPLERPTRFGAKAVLTDEEAEEIEADVKSRRDAPPPAGDPGTYNAFWSDVDRGNVTQRTSLIVDPADGRIPALTPEAQARQAARAEVRRQRGPADSYEDRNRWERCLARGLPMAPGPYNNTYQIIQSPGLVAIVMEMIHDVRIIPIEPAPVANIRTWLGRSHGRWEGETLVVETVNFVDKLDGGPLLPAHRGAMFQHNGSGETLRVIERFTRKDANTVTYQFTMDDPKTFTKPWTASVPMSKIGEQLYEYGCHEGNRGLPNIMRGARADDDAGRRNLGGGSWAGGR